MPYQLKQLLILVHAQSTLCCSLSASASGLLCCSRSINHQEAQGSSLPNKMNTCLMGKESQQMDSSPFLHWVEYLRSHSSSYGSGDGPERPGSQLYLTTKSKMVWKHTLEFLPLSSQFLPHFFSLPLPWDRTPNKVLDLGLLPHALLSGEPRL